MVLDFVRINANVESTAERRLDAGANVTVVLKSRETPVSGASGLELQGLHARNIQW